MKICICGGGNLGHVAAGFIAAKGTDEVRLLTRNPERWASSLAIDMPDGTVIHGRLERVSACAGDVIPGSDLVMLCLPGFSIAAVLREIAPWLSGHTAVGSVVSSTGFFFEAMKALPSGNPLFGFQRVPFIARTSEYGRRAVLHGYKKQLFAAVERSEAKERLRRELERLFSTPVSLMKNMYEVSLTNSNSLLHPARLYCMWKDWHEGVVYDRRSLFYEEWPEEAAALYIAMDNEFQALIGALGLTPGCIPSVLDYYESTDAASLARKLRSIAAFKGIASPMKECGGGFVPDFNTRYFTEDFPYGLAIIHNLLKEKGLPAPNINMVYEWGKGKVKG